MKKQEFKTNIKEHWNDDEFNKIRNLFLSYVRGEGHDDDYLNKLAYLLGIEEGGDEYDRWWEGLTSDIYSKFIKL